MPIPFLLAAAVIAGVSGVGAGAYGVKKTSDANDTIRTANRIVERSKDRVETEEKNTLYSMDKVGNLELEILESFKTFSDCMEKIQNRPEFKELQGHNYSLPHLKLDDLRKISVGASAIIAGISGAALGTASGVAAAGATGLAFATFGVASTGTAISALSGAAAMNATLAAIGGGSLAAGGGGIALGTSILGAGTLGVGFLIGGTVFAFKASELSDKADKAYYQAREIEEKADAACRRLQEITDVGNEYYSVLNRINSVYKQFLEELTYLVKYKTNWKDFDEYHDKRIVQNSVLLVGLLHKMCKVPLTQKNAEEEQEANTYEVRNAIQEANAADLA